MKGWVKEELINLLPPNFFHDPVPSVEKMGRKVVTESRWRWAGLFTLPRGENVFLKRDQTKGWTEILKYLVFPSKGRKEWFIAYQLRKRNLNVPKPLGWMERVRGAAVKESYYLSEGIGEGVSLAEVTDILKEKKISTELVKLVIRMHSSGLFHQDLHAGNFLWDGEAFFLTDLHRARLHNSLSLNQRLWNLSHLFHSLRSIWGKKDQLQFLEKYFEEDSIHFRKKEKYLQKIYSWMDRLQKRQWKSRTKRCLKESTEFSVERNRGAILYRRRDFPFSSLEKAIEGHLALLKERPSELIKQSPEVNVSLLPEGEGRVCIKQFNYPRGWEQVKENFRLSKGLKAWIGGNGLRVRQMPSVRPLSLLLRRSWLRVKESFLVMEALGTGQEMDRFILDGFKDMTEKRRFIRACARWLIDVHQRGVFHRDMKTCNIWISKAGETWNFRFLDWEDIRLDRNVGEMDLFRNLLQLNTSTPKTLTTADRFRFFNEYLELNPIIHDRKVFLNRLIRESKLRGLVYVAPCGVATEKL